MPYDEVICTYCDESEIEILSSSLMKKIFSSLGFEIFIIVDKCENSWMYKKIEIFIDADKNLGDYTEIEYKGNNDVNPEKIFKKLHGILNEICAIVGEEDHGVIDLS